MKKVNEVRLQGTYEQVPYARTPFYWDRRLPVAANLNAVKHRMRQHAERLPSWVVFDEISLLVPDATAVISIENELWSVGWSTFNTAADVVMTNPFGTRYTVAYTFLRHPRETFRIEVMVLGGQSAEGLHGFSPLHQALWPEGETPVWSEWAELPVPHLSFKVPPDLTFGRTTDMLRDKGYLHAQTCQSTYGHFGYYLHQDAMRVLYVKPRVNTRDGAR